MKHDEIINLLKNAGNKVSLEVEYNLPDNSISDVFSVCCKQHSITLEKEGNSYGFTVRGGYCPFQNKPRPLFITQIRPGGSADRGDLLKIGDRLVAINDYNLSQFTLFEVTKFIQESDEEAVFTIEYDVSVMEAVKNASGPLLIEIDKIPGVALGLALGPSSYQGKRCLCINELQPMSIADRCGALHVGDHILKVDGASVEHMSIAEVTQLMRTNTEGVVKLEILPVNVIKKKTARSRQAFLNGSSPRPSMISATSSPAIPSSVSAPSNFSGYKSMGSTLSAVPFGSSNSKISPRKRGLRSVDRKPASCMSLSSMATSVTFNNQVCHTETVEVILYGDSRGVGITVEEGGFSTGFGDPPIITSVHSSSPAEKCGLVKEGDRILKINGKDISDKMLDDIYIILHECRRRCDLVIEFDVTESVMATSGTFIVKLPAHGGGLGLGISGSSRKKANDPLVVTNVKRGSLAYRCGSVQAGDKILSINDVRTDTMTTEEALHLLDMSDDIIKLKLKRDDPFTDDSCEDSVTYTVELKRHGGPLGITISGTDIHTDPIIISDIIEGGLADRTGAIHIGDKLLGINSESMKGRNLTEATNLLKNAGDIVTLKIARPSETSKIKMKRKELLDREETTTPGASGDSALESWDSYGQDVIIDASGHTHPIVVGKPVMKKKISTSGYQSQDSKTRTSESTGNHSDDSDCEWGNSSSDGESCHSNNISSEDAAEWTRAFQVYENQSDLLQQIGTSLRQRSTASLDRNVKRKTASLDRRSRPSDDRRRQKYKNIAHSTARSALSEEELSNLHKPKKIPPEKGLKPSFKENVLTLYCPTPIQVQKIKLMRNSLDEGFGFGLSDGMYEKGVYVSGVKKDSIADKCGLKQFDRLLQVNGKRTRDFDCHLALPLISDSKLQLNLIVCRKPKPEIKTAKPKLDNKKNKKTTENQAVKEHNSLDEKNKMMVSRLFQVHGHFCAAHPWEVIIGTFTVTMCLMSMHMFTGGDQACGWKSYACSSEKTVSSSDVIILSVTKCLSVMYIYLQFRNLRNLESKYLIAISGVFTIFSSFVFSIAVLKIFGNDLTGLAEALPFFLLLIDLTKSCALARFALRASSQEDIQNSIGKGMAQLGPAFTLDAIVEVLVIGLGTLSGVRQLMTMCCFGCLSVLANYLAFMTFYPACLALFLDVARSRHRGSPLLSLQKLTLRHGSEDNQKTNPVTQRVKIIMSAGLALVHVHSRWTTGTPVASQLSEILGEKRYLQQPSDPEIPLWLFYVHKIVTVNADYTLTLVLAVFLTAKYMFLEEDAADILKSNSEDTLTGEEREISSENTYKDSRQVKFVLGETDSSSVSGSDEEETEVHEIEQSNKKCFDEIGTQTEWGNSKSGDSLCNEIQPERSKEECIQIMKSDIGPSALTDKEIVGLVRSKHIPAYKLEDMLGDCERGVSIRRQILASDIDNFEVLEKLPYTQYDYDIVNGACCENVIGYIPVPVGIAGPLLLDGEKCYIPMATTEGCLVASTNRGCRVLMQSGGVQTTITQDEMTRAPVVRLPNARKASELKSWLEDPDNFELVKESFDGTSRFARLKCMQCRQAGRLLYIRFAAKTGDAMGMNMLSKGSERGILRIKEHFPEMEVLSLSGNYCTDKKPSAVNWIEGRGKSVVCDATIPGNLVKNVLKTSVTDLVELNVSKNYIGSALSGSIGGFNAHAANVVTAIFIATGQDPAQNVTSSNCITVMEPCGPDGEDLYISCTMPSIEVGTVGGGTILPPQSASLDLLGVLGSCNEDPGENSRKLASIICGTVLAAELSLMSALAAGHLVKSHMKHNRSTLNVISGSSNARLDTSKCQP